MKRRNFLGMLAGAGLGVLASRTGFAQSALVLVDDPDDAADLSEESIEVMCLDVAEWQRANPRKRITIMPTHYVYGSTGR